MWACRGGQPARPDRLRPEDHHHKATTVIDESAGQVVEDLNVSGMLRHRRLSRAISASAMAGFLAKLEYKFLRYGTEYVNAELWYPSSRFCCQCGSKNETLTLLDRPRWCGHCGLLNARHADASMKLDRWPGLSFPASGRGNRVSLAMLVVVGEASTGYNVEVCPSTNPGYQISSDFEWWLMTCDLRVT